MTLYDDIIEKCDICYRLVPVEKQTQGMCHACMEQLSLTTCSECGELFRCEQVSEDFCCPKCELKMMGGQRVRGGPTTRDLLARNEAENAGPALAPKNWPGEHKGVSAMAGDDYTPEEEKSFGEKVCELIAHGLGDEEIFEILAKEMGGIDVAGELLVARVRVLEREAGELQTQLLEERGHA